MHDHHVTYLPKDGPIIWGDMHVRSRGFEMIFDSPFINSHELAKTGSLVYEDEVPHALAICRTSLMARSRYGTTRAPFCSRESRMASATRAPQAEASGGQSAASRPASQAAMKASSSA